MQQVITHHGDHDADHNQRGVPEPRRARQNQLQSLGHHDDAEHDKTDVDKNSRGKRHDGAAAAELRAGLDHLRQAHLRPLIGVQGHEHGTETGTEDDRQYAPQSAQPHARANEADHHGKKHEVAGEPERPLVPDLAVSLCTRHIVD